MSSFLAHLRGISTTEKKNKHLEIIMSLMKTGQPWTTVMLMVNKWFSEDNWNKISFHVNRDDVSEIEKTRYLNYYLNQQEDASMTESERKAKEDSERKAKDEAERKAKEEAERKSAKEEMEAKIIFDTEKFWRGCIPGVYPSVSSIGPCTMVGGIMYTESPAIRRGYLESRVDSNPFGRPAPTPVSWSEVNIARATPSHHFGGSGGSHHFGSSGIGLSSIAPPVINYRGGR